MNNTKNLIKLLGVLMLLSAFAACTPRQIAQYSPPVHRDECVAIVSTDEEFDAFAEGYFRLEYEGRGNTWLAKDETLPRWDIVGYAKTEDSTIWNRADCV